MYSRQTKRYKMLTKKQIQLMQAFSRNLNNKLIAGKYHMGAIFNAEIKENGKVVLWGFNAELNVAVEVLEIGKRGAVSVLPNSYR
jgi:hypothetical protein